MDPVTELVINAMGNGVMLALDDPHRLRAAIIAAGPDGTLADALKGEAEEFIRIRADLIEALR